MYCRSTLWYKYFAHLIIQFFADGGSVDREQERPASRIKETSTQHQCMQPDYSLTNWHVHALFKMSPYRL